MTQKNGVTRESKAALAEEHYTVLAELVPEYAWKIHVDMTFLGFQIEVLDGHLYTDYIIAIQRRFQILSIVVEDGKLLIALNGPFKEGWNIK